MFEARGKWRRWSGSRSELVRACELAADDLATWNRVPSTVEITTDLPNEITERAEGVEAITGIHRDDLPEVSSVTINVGADRAAWLDQRTVVREDWERQRNAVSEEWARQRNAVSEEWARQREAAREEWERKLLESDPASAGQPSYSAEPDYPEEPEYPERPEEPDYPQASVWIRVWGSGTKLEVKGPDRTTVEGLRNRLAEMLGRAADNAPGIDREWLIWGTPLLALITGLACLYATRSLGLASENHRLEPAEIVGLVFGLGLGAALGVALWWLFPQVELLDDGQLSRSRRFRTRFLASVGAFVIALLAAFAYGLLIS